MNVYFQHVLYHFYRFLYTDDIDLDDVDEYIILHLADKYDVTLLLRRVIQFIALNLDTENAIKAFDAGHRRNLRDLSNTSLEFILRNATACLKSPAFLELDMEEVALISSAEGLSCTEEELFEALDLIAEKECQVNGEEATDENKRKAIGLVLYNVRFTLMDSEYLISKVARRKILSEAELIAILQSQSQTDGHEDMVLDFRATPRMPEKYTVVLIAKRGRHDMRQIECKDGPFLVSFEVSHPSWLYGIMIYGPCQAMRFCTEVTLSLTNGANDTNILQNHGMLESTAGSVTCNVVFDTPMHLKEKEKYMMKLAIYTSTTSSPLFYQVSESAFLTNRDIMNEANQSRIPLNDWNHIHAPGLFGQRFRNQSSNVQRVRNQSPDETAWHGESGVVFDYNDANQQSNRTALSRDFGHKQLTVHMPCSQVAGLFLF